MTEKMNRASLLREAKESPVVAKQAKRISLLEEARKVAGEKPMSDYERYYAGQLFENVKRGNPYTEGYTQASNFGGVRRDVYSIVSIAIQNTILPEIASVQAMSSQAMMLPILEFKYGTNKGATAEGDLILDSTGAGHTDKRYDSAVVENAEIGEGVTEYLSVFTPILPGTVKVVKVDGTVVTDDGEGTLSDGGTVDYATGKVTLSSAAEEGDKISYIYDNSIIPNYLYPELDGHDKQQVGDVVMSIKGQLVQAKEHKLRAVQGLTAAYKINKEFNVNSSLVLEQQIANEMNKEKERTVMSDIYMKAAGGNAVVWSATPRPGVSDIEHVQSLPIEINKAAAEIYNRTNGNLVPNFIVAGANVVTYLAKTPNFSAAEAPANGGSFYVGMLGNLKVYQTPAIGTNDFFLGAVGLDYWQAGYIVGDYLPLTGTGEVTLSDFTTQQGWVSMYDNVMVNPQLYIRGRITA